MMNARECVLRGCTILGPTFNVRDFQVQDYFPYAFPLAWGSLSNKLQEGAVETEQNKIVIPKGSSFLVLKDITFRKSSIFPIDVLHADADEVWGETKIGRPLPISYW